MAGHIQELIRGKYYKVVAEAGRDPGTGKRRRVTRHHWGPEWEAHALLAELVKQLTHGTYRQPEKVTVAEWLRIWLHDHKALEMRPKPWASYESTARNHITPEIGAVPLHQLSSAQIQSLYSSKLKAGATPRLVRYIHQVLHGALEMAVRDRRIDFNPAKHTTRPREKPKERRALRRSEQEAFEEVLDGDPYGALFMTLLGTGMRRGELLALYWRDIDFNLEQVHVYESVSWAEGAMHRDGPKTKKGNRVIPLTELLLDYLCEHKRSMDAKGLYDPDSPVFVTRTGTIIRDRNLNRKFAALRKEAGVPKDVNLNALRHTFATRLLEAGVPMKVVQELLGHARLAHTADIYSHVDEMIEGVRPALRNLYLGTTLGTNKGPGKTK